MDLRTMKITFTDNQLGQGDTPKMRGYIAGVFPQYIELHHHLQKDRLLYRYPHIQYKILSNIPMVIGIDSGVEVLKSIYDKVDKLGIGNEAQVIFEKQITIKSEEFGISNKTRSYSFLTPWLALNEKNYEKYQGFENWEKKKGFLAKILIGNIISMSKGLGYTVSEPIKVNIGYLREVKTSLKGTSMLGFLGTFSVNFQIPDYWGIGKSVSRGFGAVIHNTEGRAQKKMKERRSFD
ncbi:hypothetical protein LR007_03825 [candidate division NPL-UPA2 bacterium]|nr:hypothetical protein [candidate division NPL-UPA2 bacterium]